MKPSHTFGAPVENRILSVFALLGLALVTGGVLYTDLLRGPWYDEFYTQYVTRASVPLWTAFRESWLADNHPPLYYALARASDWLGPIPLHRLLNLMLGLPIAVAGWIVVREDAGLRSAARLAPLGLMAMPYTLHSGSELRSYFLSLCLGVVLSLALAAIRVTGTAGGIARRTAWWLIAMAAFNTHIVTTLTCAALVAIFALDAARRRAWREFRAIAIPAGTGAIVFATIAFVQFPDWMANTRVFWIEPGFASARWSVELGVVRTCGANPVLLAGALIGALMLFNDVRLHQRPGLGHKAPAADSLAALLLLTGGVFVASAGLTVLHLIHPLLVEKYLTAMFGAILVGLSIACARVIDALPARLALPALIAGLAAGLVALFHNAQHTVRIAGWQDTAAPIARIVRACPTTAVHPAMYWNRDVMRMKPKDNAAVFPFAYRTMARAFGFRLEPVGSRRTGGRCPTIFWTEHQTMKPAQPAEILSQIRAQGFAFRHIIVHRVGSGWYALAGPTP